MRLKTFEKTLRAEISEESIFAILAMNCKNKSHETHKMLKKVFAKFDDLSIKKTDFIKPLINEKNE